MPGKLPIIYVRGFAGSTGGINQAVDDPFYGFNMGSTHVRVGGGGDPLFYQFESPLLRLVTEMGYRLYVEGSQENVLEQAIERSRRLDVETLWIHRFYDTSATTWQRDRDTDERAWRDANEGRADLSGPTPFRIETAASSLLRYVEKVLRATGAPRVHLVAHSMGGLICRSMIQRTIPDTYGPGSGRPGFGGRTRAADFVDRLFTYATPHGGIEFGIGFGLLEAIRDEFNVGGADIFGPERMYEYLTPTRELQQARPPDWDARVNPDPENFPTERIFCLVGTNPGDYAAALGLSARAVGVKSDGLVTISNALVVEKPPPGAPARTPSTFADHAFVHRSHSGRYGVVNSEEGYQNLIRFLFGDVRVTADLAGLHLPDDADLTWQAEIQVAIRGLPVLIHDRVAAHHCPIDIERGPDGAFDEDRPVPLVTTYLWSQQTHAHSRMRYTLRVRLLSLEEKDSIFRWRDHIEHTTDFDDILVIDVEQKPGGGFLAWATWASQIPVALREYTAEGDPLVDQDTTEGRWLSEVGFPAAGTFLGERARVVLAIQPASMDSRPAVPAAGG